MPSPSSLRWIILLLVLGSSTACTTDEPHPWEVLRIDPSDIGDSLQTQLDTIRDSIRSRSQLRDSLWRISERREKQAQVDLRWSDGSARIERKIVRGDTLYWIRLDPYLLNPADSSLRLGHYRHLPLPVCRASYRGGWLKSFDYESVQSIRTTSMLPASKPFAYRYGDCSIPIRGAGYYLVIAEARLFQRLTTAEQSLIDRAYKRMSEPEAIRLQRRLQDTVPLFIASEPVVVRVDPRSSTRP